MKNKSTTFNPRMKWLLLGMVLWSAIIVYRLVDLQIVQNTTMREAIAEQHRSVEKIPAIRGQVLDRNERVLALTRFQPYVFADPSSIEDPDATAVALRKILGQTKSWQAEKRKGLARGKASKYYVISWRITDKQKEAIEELKIKGLHIQHYERRDYPQGWSGSHLLGFVNRDGSVKEGLERQYDELLKGKPGRREVMRDGRRKRNGLNATVLTKPEMGGNLHLTLDANIQFFVENALRRGLKRFRAENITAIVVSPKTGAILALANVPDFNPNHFSKFKDFDRKNRAVVDVYEPASAFKIVTAAVAIDLGLLNMNERFDCEMGGIQVYDTFIKDHKPFGVLDAKEVLWFSSNVGAIKMAHRIPQPVFHQYIEAFGFGRKTAIDLPAEASGIVHPHQDWTKVSSSFLAIGHELASTPLQMLLAASVVANDGLLVRPYICEKVVFPDGREKDLRPKSPPLRVIKKETADVVRQALLGVVEGGTAKKAQVEGVEIFGKTGTAQRLQGKAYSKKNFNASFVGFFPAAEPAYGIIVVVHRPLGRLQHGGDVAAPIFSEIAEQIVAYDQAHRPSQVMQVTGKTPDWPSKQLQGLEKASTMPDLTGLRLRNLLYQCSRIGIKPHLEGEGKVVRQWPAPGEPVPPNRVCKVELGEG